MAHVNDVVIKEGTTLADVVKAGGTTLVDGVVTVGGTQTIERCPFSKSLSLTLRK